MNFIGSREAIATSQLDDRQDCQSQEVEIEPVDPIAARLRISNRWRVKEALADGESLSQKKQIFKKLKDFKLWLENQGFTWKNASNFLNFYKIFADLPLDQFEWVSLNTLFQLCQPRYAELLEKLKAIAKWTDAQVQRLMSEFREDQRTPRPKRDRTGLINLPSGGRAYQFPLLQDDLAISQILKVEEIRTDKTTAQLLCDAIALLFEDTNANQVLVDRTSTEILSEEVVLGKIQSDAEVEERSRSCLQIIQAAPQLQIE